MSVQAITATLGLMDVSSTEKLLLLVLANYADEEGCTWMSQLRMARETRLTDRTIRRSLGALADRGLISKEARFAGKGQQLTDVVTLLYPLERRSAPQAKGGGISRPGGRTLSAGGGERRSDEPLREPLREPSRASEPEPAEGQARSRPETKQERLAMAALCRDLAQTLGDTSCQRSNSPSRRRPTTSSETG